MLLLARKAGQSVVIDGNIRVTVDRIRGRVVRLKVEAPTEIRVDREEVWNRHASENQSDLGSTTRMFRQSGDRLMGRNDDSTCSSATIMSSHFRGCVSL